VNEILADAILDLVAWYEVAEDVSLEPLQQIAHHLHRLDQKDRQWFADYARRRAASERDPRYSRAFEAVADDLLTD
jgi:predicted dienelactone hydrolase